jgi:hypothetical protein
MCSTTTSLEQPPSTYSTTDQKNLKIRALPRQPNHRLRRPPNPPPKPPPTSPDCTPQARSTTSPGAARLVQCVLLSFHLYSPFYLNPSFLPPLPRRDRQRHERELQLQLRWVVVLRDGIRLVLCYCVIVLLCYCLFIFALLLILTPPFYLLFLYTRCTSTPLYTIHYSPYTIHYTPYTIHHTLYTIQVNRKLIWGVLGGPRGGDSTRHLRAPGRIHSSTLLYSYTPNSYTPNSYTFILIPILIYLYTHALIPSYI